MRFAPCGRHVRTAEKEFEPGGWHGTCELGHLCPQCARIEELEAIAEELSELDPGYGGIS